MNRCCSRKRRSARTAARLSNRKSPTSGTIRRVNRALHDPIKGRRAEPLKDTLALSAHSLGRHDIVALLVELDHVCKDFRRVLQVGVHDNDCVAGSEIQSRRDRSLVTKIAAEIQDLDR
jgi:hypothetical protein